MVRNFDNQKVFHHNEVLSLEDLGLDGELNIPEGARSIIMFIDGSGSSRFSQRNRDLSKVLNDCGMATLLFDLTTDEEPGKSPPNVELLARRICEATKWLRENGDTERLRLGYFGTGPTAAAVLLAAAALPRQVHAVVCYETRPDLAGSLLATVKAPTLLIVDSADTELLRHNREAATQLKCEHHLETVASEEDEEQQDAPESMANLARKWFNWHLNKS